MKNTLLFCLLKEFFFLQKQLNIQILFNEYAEIIETVL